jgi:hypothetical protein
MRGAAGYLMQPIMWAELTLLIHADFFQAFYWVSLITMQGFE